MKKLFGTSILIFSVAIVGCQSGTKATPAQTSHLQGAEGSIVRTIAQASEVRNVEVEPLLDHVAGSYRLHPNCEVGGTEGDPQGRQSYIRCDTTMQISRDGKKLIATGVTHRGCFTSFESSFCDISIDRAKEIGAPFEFYGESNRTPKENEVLFDGSVLKTALVVPNRLQYKYGNLLKSTFGRTGKNNSIFIAASKETSPAGVATPMVQMGRFMTGVKTSDINNRKVIRNAFINNLTLEGDYLVLGSEQPFGNSSAKIDMRFEARKISGDK